MITRFIWKLQKRSHCAQRLLYRISDKHPPVQRNLTGGWCGRERGVSVVAGVRVMVRVGVWVTVRVSVMVGLMVGVPVYVRVGVMVAVVERIISRLQSL